MENETIVNEVPAEEVVTPIETEEAVANDFAFRLTVSEASGGLQTSVEIGNQRAIQLNEIVGSVYHLLFSQTNEMLEQYDADHPDVSVEEKEKAYYSAIASTLISNQILETSCLHEVFGDIDLQKVMKAKEEIHSIAQKSFENNK